MDYPPGVLICRRCEGRLTESAAKPDRVAVVTGGLFMLGFVFVIGAGMSAVNIMAFPTHGLMVTGTLVLCLALALYHTFRHAEGMHTPTGRMLSVIGWALVLVFFAFELPYLIRHPNDQVRPTCLGLQRQLVVAVQMYYQDNSINFPPSLEALPDYERGFHIFICPVTNRRYGYNQTLTAGRVPLLRPAEMLVTADVANDAGRLAQDSDLDRTAHAHGGLNGYIASFADGHATYMPADAKVSLGPQVTPNMVPEVWQRR